MPNMPCSRLESTAISCGSITEVFVNLTIPALQLILEPIFEADFQPGSYGYRPRRTAHAAVHRVATAIAWHKTRVIDLDLRAFFDTVRHDLLLAKVAQRVGDRDVLTMLRLMLKVTGTRGVPQGGVISPLLSNLYLTEVDRMLERAKAVTRHGSTSAVEYARYADDLVVLVQSGPSVGLGVHGGATPPPGGTGQAQRGGE